MFHKKIVQQNKTNILCPIIFFNYAIYEITRKNTAEPDRPEMAIWHMHRL